MQERESFTFLAEAIRLYRLGRKNAAIATWKTLPAAFQSKAIDAAILVLEEKPAEYMPQRFDTPFGTFTMAESVVDHQTITFSDWADVVPALAEVS